MTSSQVSTPKVGSLLVKAFLLAAVTLIMDTHATIPATFSELDEFAMAFASFKEAYTMFHQRLTNFVHAINGHLNLDGSVPDDVWNGVYSIPDIIHPADFWFLRWNVPKIKEAVRKITIVTDMYIRGIRRCGYVNPQDIAWYERKKGRVMSTMFRVRSKLEQVPDMDPQTLMIEEDKNYWSLDTEAVAQRAGLDPMYHRLYVNMELPVGVTNFDRDRDTHKTNENIQNVMGIISNCH